MASGCGRTFSGLCGQLTQNYKMLVFPQCLRKGCARRSTEVQIPHTWFSYTVLNCCHNVRWNLPWPYSKTTKHERWKSETSTIRAWRLHRFAFYILQNHSNCTLAIIQITSKWRGTLRPVTPLQCCFKIECHVMRFGKKIACPSFQIHPLITLVTWRNLIPNFHHFFITRSYTSQQGRT